MVLRISATGKRMLTFGDGDPVFMPQWFNL
jgi:hypothetical protein